MILTTKRLSCGDSFIGRVVKLEDVPDLVVPRHGMIDIHCWHCDVKTAFPDFELPSYMSILGNKRTEAKVDRFPLPLVAAQFAWVSKEVLSVRPVYQTHTDLGNLIMLVDDGSRSEEDWLLWPMGNDE